MTSVHTLVQTDLILNQSPNSCDAVQKKVTFATVEVERQSHEGMYRGIIPERMIESKIQATGKNTTLDKRSPNAQSLPHSKLSQL